MAWPRPAASVNLLINSNLNCVQELDTIEIGGISSGQAVAASNILSTQKLRSRGILWRRLLHISTFRRKVDHRDDNRSRVEKHNSELAQNGFQILPCTKIDRVLFVIDIFNRFQKIRKELVHADFLGY